jgi:glycosyltransferase involved in cell wall biosynthesis
MRIAIWSEAFSPSLGGLERFSEELARWLSVRNHEVVVVTRTPVGGSRYADEPYEVLRRPSAAGALRALRHADVVQVAGTSMKGVALARLAGRRVIVTHAGPQLVCPSGLAWSERGLCPAGPALGPCRWCDRHGPTAWAEVRTRRELMTRAATNVFASRYLRSRCGLAGSVIYNPVPPSAFTERGEDVPAGDTIVSAGRFVREKGLDVLLRAMAHVDARLVLAGDGPLRGALEALTADLGLGGRVVFPGRVTFAELQALYAEAVLACVPSVVGEAFGYAVAEAMAAGVPVVGAPTGAIPELLEDGRGFVATSVTHEALAASIRQALLDEDDRADRANRATVFAREQLHVDVIGRRYEELYGI